MSRVTDPTAISQGAMRRDEQERASVPDWYLVLILLLGGLAVRLFCLHVQGGIARYHEFGEATRIALSLAQKGTYADAFFRGEGPTAHILPVMPLIAGAVFWLAGTQSSIAGLILVSWSLAQTLCGYALLQKLFATLGAGRAARLGTLTMLCFLPAFAKQEVIEFRYWEGAFAVCLVSLNMLLLLRLDRRETVRLRNMLAIGGLSALTFFVSPPAGLGVDTCWAIFAARRLSLRQAVQFGTIAAAALALLVVPWTIRNIVQLGSLVPLRDDFGLELAIGNYPGALGAPDPGAAFITRLDAIHPYRSAEARAAMVAAGGEAAYAKSLGRQTESWIRHNPLTFLQLAASHYDQFFFPRPWEICFPNCQGGSIPLAWIISSVDLLGLLTLVVGLFRRRRGYWMLATYVGLVSLPYALVQPIPRYTYLIYGFMAFLAGDGVSRVGGWLAARLVRSATPVPG
jgi:hypothetical protein